MITVKRIRTLPENFSEFVHEVAEGIGALYGACAADSYRRSAARQIQLGMQHLGVAFYGAFDGMDAAGMATTVLRGSHGYVSFVHVLDRFAGGGVEAMLVQSAVDDLRRAGAVAIVAENIDFSRLDLEGVYGDLQFGRVDRLLMKAQTSDLVSGLTPGRGSIACLGTQYDEVAEVIYQAYLNHPGRDLHPEVQEIGSTREFVRLAAIGAFGVSEPSYVRILRQGGRPAAAIVGCEAAPDTGFVLQVACVPAAQRKGMATRLLRDLAQEFAGKGLGSVVLGVTLSNPAKLLYEKLGFGTLRPVTAYVWWASPSADRQAGAEPARLRTGE
ncbi:MAG: hypothetical protein AMXMBFR84_10750 [Candidatus Hydrogenedentota bacterium]